MTVTLVGVAPASRRRLGLVGRLESPVSAARASWSLLLRPCATPVAPAANITAPASSAEMPTKIEERRDFECFGRCGHRVDKAAHLRVTDRALAEPRRTSCEMSAPRRTAGRVG